MGATAWDTLFHLCNFMKHLLLEVAPKENLDCPKYVEESLFELLSSTLEYLNKARIGNFHKADSRRISQTGVEKETGAMLQSHSNHNNQVPCQNSEKSAAYHNSEFVSPIFNKSSPKTKSEDVIASLPVHKSIVISKNFATLSYKMQTGQSFGCYCLPCGSPFSAKIEWMNHCKESSHIRKIQNQKCDGINCDRCKFLVFGVYSIASVYMDFHCRLHSTSSSHASNESLIPQHKQDLHHGVNLSGRIKGDTSEHKKRSAEISFTFDEVQYEMAMGLKKEGFYCYFCDNKYFKTEEWKMHFEEIQHFQNLEDPHFQGKIIMCKSCPLKVFASISVQNKLLKHHDSCHFALSKSQQTNSTAPLDDLENDVGSKEQSLLSNGEISDSDQISSSRSTSTPSLCHNSTELSSKKKFSPGNDIRSSINDKVIMNRKKREYVIRRKFIDINEKIHLNHLVGVYYCHPCDAAYLNEQWKEHIIQKCHVKYMQSVHFKNIQGVCSHCQLTIIGTERTVHGYMEYHSPGHLKTASYSCDALGDIGNVQANDGIKSQKRRLRKKKQDYSVSEFSTTKSEEIQNVLVHHEKEIEDVCLQRSTSLTCSGDLSQDARSERSGNCSWYETSRDESIRVKFQGMYNSRVEQLNSRNPPDFGGFCIPCDIVTESAFEWMDHICSNEHTSRLSVNDEELEFCEFNMRVFGNKAHIPKFLVPDP